MEGPIAPTPGPILAKQDNDIETPSINVNEGSRNKVTKEPKKKEKEFLLQQKKQLAMLDSKAQ